MSNDGKAGFPYHGSEATSPKQPIHLPGQATPAAIADLLFAGLSRHKAGKTADGLNHLSVAVAYHPPCVASTLHSRPARTLLTSLHPGIPTSLALPQSQYSQSPDWTVLECCGRGDAAAGAWLLFSSQKANDGRDKASTLTPMCKLLPSGAAYGPLRRDCANLICRGAGGQTCDCGYMEPRIRTPLTSLTVLRCHSPLCLRYCRKTYPWKQLPS